MALATHLAQVVVLRHLSSLAAFPLVGFTCLAGLLVLAQPAQAQASRRQSSVRWTDAHVAALVHEGLRRSPSFRALAEHLDDSDVVVYVTCARLPGGIDGQLTFLSAAGGHRYLLVRLAWDRPERQKIAALGHELQHAVEIAQRARIVDEGSLAAAFREFGFERQTPLRAGGMFDSYAAIDMGGQVWREIAGPVMGD